MKELLSPLRAGMIAILLLGSQVADCQLLMDMIDTTSEVGKGLLYIYKKFDRINIGGYMQPQFQLADRKGAESFNGGNFAAQSNNRFMLRRGRVRFEYTRFNDKSQPGVQFVLQFDGTERGVVIRDFWARIFENKWELFALSVGMFPRPFGNEINVSSSDRETPERGRMSQTLMKTERDLGAMISFYPRRKDHPLRYFKLDLGVFNGQGLTGPNEYDSYKDLISRATLRSFPVTPKIDLSMGVSMLHGGLIQNTKYVYQTVSSGGHKDFVVDSAANNLYAKAPRIYYGTDMQLKLKHKWGTTELRGEYWWGTQTGTATDSETPGLVLTAPYYIRKFNGAFFYFLQNIINKKHQVGVKYDWYDPNTEVKGMEIGAGNNMNQANIRYDTWSVGYNYFMDEHVKLFFWYDFVNNEKTSLANFASNLKSNVLTCRMQYRF